MTKSGKRLYEVTDKLMHLFAWVSAGVVLFNFVLLCANVFMRYVFDSPIKGASEIVTMMMAWVAYSGMAYTLLNGKHMQLEALYEKLQGKAKHIASFFIYLLATILFLFFVKASFDVFWQSWTIKEESVASVTVYVFIGKAGTLVGWILLLIQAALMTIYCAMGMAHPDKYEPIGAFTEIPDEEALKQLIKEDAVSEENTTGDKKDKKDKKDGKGGE